MVRTIVYLLARVDVSGLARLWLLVGLLAATVGCRFRVSYERVAQNKSLVVSQTLFDKSGVGGLERKLSDNESSLVIGPIQSQSDSDGIKAAGSATGEILRTGAGLP